MIKVTDKRSSSSDYTPYVPPAEGEPRSESDRRAELERRRIELRYEIGRLGFSGLGVDVLSSRVAEMCRLERAPFQRELAAVETELESLGWRRPLSPWRVFGLFFLVFFVILPVGFMAVEAVGKAVGIVDSTSAATKHYCTPENNFEGYSNYEACADFWND